MLDTDWNPFDDHLLASGSDDGKVFLWRVPEGFTLHTDAEDPADVSPVGRLTGHSRKVGHVMFNPAAENVLASSSGDYTIKLWDIEQGSSRLTLKHADIVQSLSWSADGALMVTTSRDKKLRIWDVRQEKPVQENPVHTAISAMLSQADMSYRDMQEQRIVEQSGWASTIESRRLVSHA